MHPSAPHPPFQIGLKRVLRVIKFYQKFWLIPYIDMKAEKRRKAKNDSEIDVYKFMNDAIF